MNAQYGYIAMAIFVVIATLWVALRPQKPVAAFLTKDPSCCPICFSANLVQSHLWEARSAEPGGQENKKIREYYCADPRCSRSFWV